MADVQGEMSTTTAIMEGWLNALGSDADALCKQHLVFVMTENKTKGWAEKSVLYAQTRVRGNSLSVVWYKVKWYGQKATGTRRMSKTLIRQPKHGHGYTIPRMTIHAQPWEMGMVIEVETELTKIRRKASALSKALLHFKQFERLETE